ncbi:fimbrial protein YehD [Salmonella enterica]|uniref:fimbrial protein YehD n=1 Tax=Salmonella enterica TaxID=28901 RepID=UPI000CDBDE8B|nr:fimbrial protein YehD [Salmonella enterica]AUX97270.1 hypothetical protein C3F37_09915 [Salmonella enterica subsp. enterica serovar Senftenberg]QBY72458.1 fimbrial protein YehD [Salmonella enterica subsp. enterica serovar Senftenberg]QBY81722.1 fimbrial protein YehD [Salmonella enterica subsp. enterica serovar Senftenberg]QCC12260.1 fimbrial protein YehD [Salmonella enterica subsp. enterica serovar Senftenberg]
MGEIAVKTGNNARNGGKNSLNRLIRCVCGKKIGPDPRNFNQRVNLGRNDLLIRTFPSPEAILKVRCTNTANPRISFNRSQFVDNMQITKNNATNNGAGFAVYLDGIQVKPDEAGNYTLNSSKFENGVYTLNFSARYAAVENTVTPGSVESVLTMTVLTD